MANYYDDQKRLIATSLGELVLYFNSLPGVVNAANIPITLPCNPLGVIRVASSGVVPKFIYQGQPIPKNKIYPQLLPSDTLNLAPLCNGVTVANTLPAPDCGTVVCVTLYIVPPDCGAVVFISGYIETVTITPWSAGGWALYGPIESTVANDGTVTLNVSVINSGITVPTAFSGELLLTIGSNGRPGSIISSYTSASHPNMPPSSSLQINSGGQLSYTGPETSVSALGAVVEIFNIQFNTNY